jgi:hypothetical protein
MKRYQTLHKNNYKQTGLLNATEPCIRTSGWWFQSSHQATLRHRTARKQAIEISHTAPGMEFFFQRITQLARIDAGFIMAKKNSCKAFTASQCSAAGVRPAAEASLSADNFDQPAGA